VKLCENLHQIKIDFHVTPEIKRYVYLYLLTGEKCYLIDSGVAGAETILADYMAGMGRTLEDIAGVFLTHAHPDHIGGAAQLKARTGCQIYASQGERPWIQDIHLQHKERPIPNFFSLVKASAPVDQVLKDGRRLTLEEGITLRVLGSAGHSQEGLSYLWEEQGVVFTGDAIPVAGDIPIWIDTAQSVDTLRRLQALEGISLYCPAWDKAYDPAQGQQKLADALTLIHNLKEAVAAIPGEDLDDLVQTLCTKLGTPHFLQNPLFRRTVAALR